MDRPTLIQRFNRRFPYPVRLGLIALVGLGLLPLVQASQVYGLLFYHVVTDPTRSCPMPQLLRTPGLNSELMEHRARAEKDARVVARDPQLGIIQVSSLGHSLWVKDSGDSMNGEALIPYLIAEHLWMGGSNPAESVQPGDTVIDCGAHVGTFTADALARGARLVISIEPDATNLECLRRNFAREIAGKRVILIPKAAWSEETTLKFTISDLNSGMNSAVIRTGTREIDVPATTIDAIVREHGIDRVDYLKMDIEGAERHALRGGMETLKRDRPRMMLEAYHLEDDHEVLPRLLREAHSGYQEVCGPCERDLRTNSWRPYVLYYR
jgi:FkbM family methyltransferase